MPVLSTVPMADREIWDLAGRIVAEHGEGSRAYIATRVDQVREYPVTVQDWGRVAAATDAILSAGERC